MELRTTEERLSEFLNTLPLGVLRNVGRQTGVRGSSALTKGTLIAATVAILTGQAAPAPRSKKGAPVKQEYVDPSVLQKIKELCAPVAEQNVLQVGAPIEGGETEGILEISENGSGYLRAGNGKIRVGDAFVSRRAIERFGLRAGDYVVGCTEQIKDAPRALTVPVSVNGVLYEEGRRRGEEFGSYAAVYPSEKIRLGEGGDPLLRQIDLFAPVGKGARALIVASDCGARGALFAKTVRAVVRDTDLNPIFLLIGGRPEEETEIRALALGAELFSVPFDGSAEERRRIAALAFLRAKRIAESGKNAVVLLDSLTRLARSYATADERSYGAAVEEAMKLFGAARNLDGAGSLTVVATVDRDDEDGFSKFVLERFRGTETCRIVLNERADGEAELDLNRSETRRAENLLTAEEVAVVRKLRESGAQKRVAESAGRFARSEDDGTQSE